MSEPREFDSILSSDSTPTESRTESDMTPPPVPSVKRPLTKSTTPSLDFLRPGEAPGELGRLGGYRILKVVGVGGMGVVFQAEDPSLKRLVALKVMKPLLAVHDHARQRFTREAQSAAAINHEHVVHIYQVGEDQSVPFLAMELLEGESLDMVLRREKQLSLPEVLRISREIASGLSAAHRRGLIHRDIKPANIVLVPIDPTVQVERTLTNGSDFIMPTSSGPTGSSSSAATRANSSDSTNIWLTRVKIVDFGLARATDGDAELTQSGQVTGTPQYMSPEQAEGVELDHRSDLFSLGCVMYRMLCGETPFSGRSSSALLLAIAERPHKPLREHLPNILAPVEAVIDRLLAKSPNDRFQSALELMQTLADLERRLATWHQLEETTSLSLRRLELYGNSTHSWASLAPLLKIQESLIGVMKLDPDRLARLAELPQLQSLTFDRIDFTSESLTQIGKRRHLRQARVSDCELTEADWTKIVEALPHTELAWNGKPRTP